MKLNTKGQKPVSNYLSAIIIAAIALGFLFYLIMVYPSERAGALSGEPQNTVIIKDFSFQPDVLEVSAGTTVTWVNYDNTTHAVSGAVFGGRISPGSSYSYKFSNPGTYDYSCSIHPYMSGRVIVT
jgi:plastocyanin